MAFDVTHSGPTAGPVAFVALYPNPLGVVDAVREQIFSTDSLESEALAVELRRGIQVGNIQAQVV